MAIFAVLNNRTGAAGKVRNIAVAVNAIHSGWIEITNTDPKPQKGWDYDGAGNFVRGVDGNSPRYQIFISDIRDDAQSIIDRGDDLPVSKNSILEFDFMVFDLKKDQPATVSKNNTRFVLKGLFGTPPKIMKFNIVNGMGTATVAMDTEGVYILDDEGVNFAVRKNPKLTLRFDQDKTITVD